MTDEEMLNLTDADRWNPAHFGESPLMSLELLLSRFLRDGDQLTIFFDESDEPPLPEEFITLHEFEKAWKLWEIQFPHLVTTSRVSTTY
jgi:hypothetical protein